MPEFGDTTGRFSQFAMKHYLFEFLGDKYPHSLENRHGHVLTRIAQLWGKPEIENYFMDLVVDKRGGRIGFARDAMADILMLSELSHIHVLRKNHEKHKALKKLKAAEVSPDIDSFLYALKNGDKNLIDLLVRSGLDMDFIDAHGNSPLLLAIKKGHPEIAQILILAGADVNAYDKDGMSPLLICCHQISPEFAACAEFLIKRGALVNDRDQLGFTPLMLTVSAGVIGLSKLLIERGANVNARSATGATPLSLAKALDTPAISDLLIGMGAIS